MVYDGWGKRGSKAAARFDSITSGHRQLTKESKAAFPHENGFRFLCAVWLSTGIDSVFGEFASDRAVWMQLEQSQAVMNNGNSVGKKCHAEVLRSIWPARADEPDASQYLSMTIITA